jgi:hypothetical protein
MLMRDKVGAAAFVEIGNRGYAKTTVVAGAI